MAGAIFLFGFAVFVHELGHFLVAKACGVGVRAFAIGFGKWKIWSFTWRETEYSIRWIPLGGFVSLKGMVEEESVMTEGPEGSEDSEGDEKSGLTEDLDALRNKHPLARMAVFVAGVSFNFITAILFFALLLWYGVPKPLPMPNQLESVKAESPLYQMGWRSGDRILAVERTDTTAEKKRWETENWTEVWEGIEAALSAPPAWEKGGALTTLTLQVERSGETLRLPLPTSAFLSDEAMASFSPPWPAYVGGVIPATPAHRARLAAKDVKPGEGLEHFPPWEDMPFFALKENDRVLAVDGKLVQSWQDMTELLRARPDKLVTLTIDRDGKTYRLATTLERSEENPEQGRLGIIRGMPSMEERDRMPLHQALWEAPGRTWHLTVFIVQQTVKTFTKSGKEIKRNLGGPLMIGKMAYEKAQQGLSDYLNLLIVISIVLAVMNLLPIPVLDGGYILITLIEIIIRRPIPQRILAPILTVFFFLFMLLFVFIFYNDIMNMVVR